MIGSLFSGIGGLELGLERAGLGPVAWQVELSDYCRSILARHWPDAERFADVRTVGADQLRLVDVVCGGFPCQDISSAGRRAGIDGEKSGLWSEYARIVETLRPPLVVIENVAALRSRGLGRVLRDLAARGYDAEWDCVPAAAVGAPHLRDRLFVVAYAHGDALRLLAERLESQSAERRHAEPLHDGGARPLADAASERREQQRAAWVHGEGPRRDDIVGCGADAVPDAVQQGLERGGAFLANSRPRSCRPVAS